MVDMASTDIMRYPRLDNKRKQKYGLFAKFALVVVVSCEVSKNLHIFITRANQHEARKY